MDNDIEKIIFTPKDIAQTVQKLGEQLSADYKGKNLLMVCVLKGSSVFMADLMRAISIPCKIDFLEASSYGSGAVSSGNVEIKKDIAQDLNGIDVLIIEDIVDTGFTLQCLMEKLSQRNPSSLKVCTLFDKPDRRENDFRTDYKGVTVPNEFIVGYGLDYNENYRNLPYIGVLKREIYS